MLEVVDARFDRFVIRDGAQMPCHLEAALVGLGDRGAKLLARDMRVRLERRDPSAPSSRQAGPVAGP